MALSPMRGFVAMCCVAFVVRWMIALCLRMNNENTVVPLSGDTRATARSIHGVCFQDCHSKKSSTFATAVSKRIKGAKGEFHLLDNNGDGVLSRAEWNAGFTETTSR